MILTYDEFIARTTPKYKTGFGWKEDKIGTPDKEGITTLMSGAFEVEDEYTLSGSFPIDDGKRWVGRFVIEHYADPHDDKTDRSQEQRNMCYLFPSKEEPYELYVFGNDDTSFTQVFPTEQDAIDFLHMLANMKPDTPDFYEHMVFTN